MGWLAADIPITTDAALHKCMSRAPATYPPHLVTNTSVALRYEQHDGAGSGAGVLSTLTNWSGTCESEVMSAAICRKSRKQHVNKQTQVIPLGTVARFEKPPRFGEQGRPLRPLPVSRRQITQVIIKESRQTDMYRMPFALNSISPSLTDVAVILGGRRKPNSLAESKAVL